jgi:hypothetical protein
MPAFVHGARRGATSRGCRPSAGASAGPREPGRLERSSARDVLLAEGHVPLPRAMRACRQPHELRAHRTTSRGAGRQCSFPTKPAACGPLTRAPLAIELDDEQRSRQAVARYRNARRAALPPRPERTRTTRLTSPDPCSVGGRWAEGIWLAEVRDDGLGVPGCLAAGQRKWASAHDAGEATGGGAGGSGRDAARKSVMSPAARGTARRSGQSRHVRRHWEPRLARTVRHHRKTRTRGRRRALIVVRRKGHAHHALTADENGRCRRLVIVAPIFATNMRRFRIALSTPAPYGRR